MINQALHLRHFRICCTTALSGALWIVASGTANAEIIETSQASTSYEYSFWGNPDKTIVDAATAGDSGGIIIDNVNSNNNISRLSLDYTSQLGGDGSFYFLHNAYCVGSCTVGIMTNITFSLTNNGPNTEYLRFDSLITPGHLANMLETTGVSSAGFGFKVAQGDALSPDPADILFSADVLYSADGSSRKIPYVKVINDGVFSANSFNGWTEQGMRGEWLASDWSATNLNVNLNAIAPGASTTLVYSTFTWVDVSADGCTSLFDGCEGHQTAFGDPRNNGSGTVNQMRMASFAASAQQIPVIGAEYLAYRTPYRFVSQSTPLPDSLPAYGPIPYNIPIIAPTNGAVPEPGTWLLMILGFGFIGAATRRRRRNPVGSAAAPRAAA